LSATLAAQCVVDKQDQGRVIGDEPQDQSKDAGTQLVGVPARSRKEAIEHRVIPSLFFVKAAELDHS
jgi:hypothetical protein